MTDYSDVSQWRAVFWISACVHVAGSLVYLVWGSDQVQAWAVISQPDVNKNSTKQLRESDAEEEL